MKSFIYLLFTLFLSAQAQTWPQILKGLASDRSAGAHFGGAVAIDGAYAVVGAYREGFDAAGANEMSSAGAAYVFHLEAGVWQPQAKLVAADRNFSDFFGASVAISGDYVVVGAYQDEAPSSGSTANSGSAYVFKRTGTSWAQEAKLVSADIANADLFGYAVGISGDYVVVGAYQEDEDASGSNTLNLAGSAYVFKRTGTTWAQEAKLVASDRDYGNLFGYAVGISGDYVVVGAYEEDEDASGGSTLNNAGAAYVFKRTGTTWAQEAKLVASVRAAGARVGMQVAIDGDYVVLGTYNDGLDAAGANPMFRAGAAYVFYRTGTTWAEQAKLVASDRAAAKWFGYSVAISGDRICVGAISEDRDADGLNAMFNAGAGYVYERVGVVWTQQAKIVAADREAGNNLGYSVGISGDYTLCGAIYESHDVSGGNSLGNAGAAYFFTALGVLNGKNNIILSVELTKGKIYGLFNSIENKAEYILEGSYDTTNFSEIGSISDTIFEIKEIKYTYIRIKSNKIYSNIVKIMKNNNLNISSNPFTDQLYIKISEYASAKIYDSMGNVLFNLPAGGQLSSYHLDTSGLPPGIYILQLDNGENYKLLKQ